jgi:hypothetical protein
MLQTRALIVVVVSALAGIPAVAQTPSQTQPGNATVSVSQQHEQVNAQIADLEKALADLKDRAKALQPRATQEQLLKQLNLTIDRAEASLSAMLTHYSPQHPEVRNFQSYVDFLHRQREALQKQ